MNTKERLVQLELQVKTLQKQTKQQTKAVQRLTKNQDAMIADLHMLMDNHTLIMHPVVSNIEQRYERLLQRLKAVTTDAKSRTPVLDDLLPLKEKKGKL